jgi:hypothetical protein
MAFMYELPETTGSVKMNGSVIICVAALSVSATGMAYEKAFEATKPGTIEVKLIPERTVIVAQKDERYFEGDNALFGQLFRYIKDNDVAMTVPVKAEIDPGRMFFYIGSSDLSKELRDTVNVKVIQHAQQRVLSIGVRSGYSEKNFEDARQKLFDAIAVSETWVKNGDAYAVYWNGPYVPSFMKRFEVHLPIAEKKDEKKDETALVATRPL